MIKESLKIRGLFRPSVNHRVAGRLPRSRASAASAPLRIPSSTSSVAANTTRSCCFRLQDWLTVLVGIIIAILVIAIIINCIRCLCCW
ncbi:hypothetical protein M3Y99_01278700 [Aphelenchoides fujianensis]|nr:hypothetical protein M3Y99_01278700 [Aphelenchoides fujianensis]